MFNTKIFQ